MKKQYRLPDGGITTDVEAYLAAWEEFASVTLEFFPGYTANGYDPNVVLDSNVPYAPLLRLTVSEVKALREYRDRKQAEIAALQEEVRLLRAAEEPRSFDRPTKLPRLIVVAVLEWLLTQDPTSMEGLRASMNWDEGFDYEWDDEVEALSLKVSKHFDATWKRWAEEAEEDS
jgi:hypothetical protein